MPQMNGTGPEGKDSGTGRKLGNCRTANDAAALSQLGVGMGKRRKMGGGEGQKKRKIEGNQ